MNSQEPDYRTVMIAFASVLFITLIVSNWSKIFSPRSLSSLMGEWTVYEKLNLKKGRSEIIWEYRADVINKNILRMSGHKIKVNNQQPNKQEQLDRLVYNCTFKDLQSRCKLDELNSNNPILGAEAKLNFNETFNSFSGKAYQNGTEVSTLTGYK
jgi:hypothetical protein